MRQCVHQAFRIEKRLQRLLIAARVVSVRTLVGGGSSGGAFLIGLGLRRDCSEHIGESERKQTPTQTDTNFHVRKIRTARPGRQAGSARRLLRGVS
jgi:hypothetical protein